MNLAAAGKRERERLSWQLSPAALPVHVARTEVVLPLPHAILQDKFHHVGKIQWTDKSTMDSSKWEVVIAMDVIQQNVALKLCPFM